MIAWFKNLLFERIAFELICKYPLDESVRILSEKTIRSMRDEGYTTQPVGNVSKRFVELTRYRPNIRNSFKPYFIGAFYQDGSKVVLRGIYRMHYFVFFFMVAWLGYFSLLIVGVVRAEGGISTMRGIGTLFFGFGFLLLVLGKLTWRGDVEWLSDYFRKTLQ